MKEAEIAKELARRTSLSEEATAEVLHSIRDLIEEGRMDGAALQGLTDPPPVPPDDPSLVDRVIARAKKHPLGLEFLASGLLATVAITLGAHAFTVEAARRRLQKEQQAKEAEAK